MSTNKGYYKSLHFTNVFNKEEISSKSLQDKIKIQVEQFPTNSKVKMEIVLYDEEHEMEKKRTEQQNKYYHKILDILSQYTGDTHMQLHEAFKCMFLGRPLVIKDKEYIVVKSTTSLTSKNFSEYLERIFSWAGENGITLPVNS